ncbi:PASTA domain-containing protein [Turneriella parva]|uniref:PASTA domain containing protein n=1 Tax=Turneriella parva (strain ATCC BAA-1111 / DSM 21527 / NCTC 11395 / H) TaxID=869212 RepID=I4B8E7_TURPD|nr:serine/threonine protein kinase [Turneriella parva]AFM13554.1 PASTA domain containing protein [Turneriella parva DSM 21527]
MATSEDSAPVPKMLYFKHVARILIFYFVGLSIFFVSGFTIFKVLFADTERTVVPDVVGRLFLGEHNKLREDFKVDLKPAYLVQYPYGYILAQNLTPGKSVDKNTKLELLVNFSDAIVQVPKLVGFSEDLVDGSIASLPVGGRIFSLRKGVITRVFSAQPKREVLAQFPPAGTPVIPNTPVSLLISDGPAPAGAPQASAAPKLEKGLAVSIALNAAYHLKKPAVISLKKTDKADENAALLSDAVVGEKEIQLEVGTLEESLASGKSAIDLEDLPFTQLVVAAKKWGEADAVLTIARREPVANEDGSLYSEYYLVRNSSPLPVFRRRDDAFDVYRDYYTPVTAAPVAAKTNEPAQTTIVGETQQAAPVAEVQKPDKTVRLKADTL